MSVTLDHVKRRLNLAKASSSLESFVDSLYAKASSDLFETFDAESLYAIAVSAYKFLKKANTELALRVYNPEYQADGWETPYTLVELRLQDRPFIVDSVKAALERQGYQLHHLLHPVLVIERDEQGILQNVALEGKEDSREAYELYFIEKVTDEVKLETLELALKDVLHDVVLATNAYLPMREKIQEVRSYLQGLYQRRLQEEDEARAEALMEYASFLQWLDEDNFVFLGYREYDIVRLDKQLHLHAAHETSLGILSKPSSTYKEPIALDSLPPELRERVVGGRPLMVSKTNAESTVHRPVRMDYIGIKKLDADWQVQGERRFIGLFTSRALATPVEQIPLLRLKLRRVLALDKAVPGSHDYKQIATIFNSMPRDGLFWVDSEQLHKDIRTIMRLEQEKGVRLSIQADPLGRGLSAMVMMPRERFNAEVRRDIQSFLSQELAARHVDYQLAMGEDESQLRFHFFFTTHKTIFDLDVPELERQVTEFTKTWDDHLSEKLKSVFGDARAESLCAKYLSALDDVYKADTNYTTALRDIEQFEALPGQSYLVELVNPLDEEGMTFLNIYHEQKTLILSEIMPFLENLGLRVLEQSSYSLDLGMEKPGLDIFKVTDLEGQVLDVRAHGQRLSEALVSLLKHEAESDPLNQLVLNSGLSIRQVSLLLAYRMYYFQLHASVSRDSVTQALLHHPQAARMLFDAFNTRFNPQLDTDRLAGLENTRVQLEDYLEDVRSLAEDTILRRLFNLIEATLRTNYFQNKAVISFKLDSSCVSSMPEPRPMFEIGVYGLEVEGTHLRGGKVARGGIRWSDRPDDFRTEVLGLMKTQMTNNAVIVPVGSKGGFIVKQAPATRGELRAYVERQYKAYISALLDITDNRVNGNVIHPRDLIVYDDADPYLVVAADKGTATFSDIANGISEAYDFWLGDAFASGGSNGYDHKKEGITARGAWECVTRHFAEMNLDVMQDEFTVMGIGDMSGDVFGNGMLYTPKIRLQAAFNHLHIFVDPNPEAQESFEERKRLFDLPRSSWTDYKSELISQGGGVYERSAKSIDLSPEVQAMLGVDATSLSGQELIKAILTMPVDLFWNGGIGTYVKASFEQDSDAGDSANDTVRISAPELKAKVVGEGGNLGFTQRARIEYNLGGGRINTDAIDNSAGVDMSDHEVNIKIMLRPLVSSGDLSDVQRNRLLEVMTDEVSDLVLKNNFSQSLAIALAEQHSKNDLASFVSLMDNLSEASLDPAVEFLPNRDALADRQARGQGLSRPELAILLAYTKMRTYAELLESSLPDATQYLPYLIDYFPEQLSVKHQDALVQHSLKREIIATQLTNLVTDLLGMTFVHELSQETQAGTAAIVKASVDILELLKIPVLKQNLEHSASSMLSNYAALQELRKHVKDIVRWHLATELNLEVDLIQQLCKGLRSFLPKEEKKRFDAQVKHLERQKLSKDLSGDLVGLSYLPSSMGIIHLFALEQKPLKVLAKTYYHLGERLHLGWWRDALQGLDSKDNWEARALKSLIWSFREIQTSITQKVLMQEETELQSSQALEQYEKLINDIKDSNAMSLASGSVALSVLQSMI